MNNFLKWIEYLATGNEYALKLLKTYDMNSIEFNLQFKNHWEEKDKYHWNSSLELDNFQPRKLWDWKNAMEDFAYNNGCENDSPLVKQTAQNLLKLIEELKHNRIELKHLKNKIHLIMFDEEDIILEFEDCETFKFENGHFKELNQTTEFKKLIYYFKAAKITMEQK